MCQVCRGLVFLVQLSVSQLTKTLFERDKCSLKLSVFLTFDLCSSVWTCKHMRWNCLTYFRWYSLNHIQYMSRDFTRVNSNHSRVDRVNRFGMMKRYVTRSRSFDSAKNSETIWRDKEAELPYIIGIYQTRDKIYLKICLKIWISLIDSFERRTRQRTLSRPYLQYKV